MALFRLISILITISLWPVAGQYQADYLDSRHGLTNEFINEVFQDTRGYIWLTAYDGLYRFDGYRCERLIRRDEQGRPTRYQQVFSGLSDDDRYVWFGGSYGVERFDYQTGTRTRMHPDSSKQQFWPADNAIKILRGPFGRLWVGGRNGLYCYDEQQQTVRHYQHLPADSTTLPANWIEKMHLAPDSTLWFGTIGGGLVGLDLKNENRGFKVFRTKYPALSGPTGSIIKAINNGPGRQLMVGNLNGLFLIDPANGDVQPLISEKLAEQMGGQTAILALEPASENRYWVSVYRNGVYAVELDPENKYAPRWEKQEWLNNINADFRDIFVDRSNVVWLTTFRLGAVRASKRQPVAPPETLPEIVRHTRAASILIDNQQRIWVGQEDRRLVCLSHQGELQFVVNVNEHTSDKNLIDRVGAIVQDSQERIWMVTRRSLLKWDEASRRPLEVLFLAEDGEPAERGLITHITAGPDENLWMAGSNGLWQYDPGSGASRFFSRDSLMPEAGFEAVLDYATFDHSGKLWMHVNGLGLFFASVRKNSNGVSYLEKISQFDWRDEAGIPIRTINALLEGQDSVLWVATDRGLYAISPDRRSVNYYGREIGLLNDNIRGLCFDENGVLWASTGFGLCQLLPGSERGQPFFIRYFNRDSGLENNFFSENVFVRDSQGRFWIGGEQGLDSFDPGELHLNTSPPQICITSIEVDGKQIKNPQAFVSGSPLTLQATQKLIALEFSIMDYQNPQASQYAYRLSGFDDNWQYLAPEAGRRVYYTNLDPGTYRFEVRGANSDGVWSENRAEVSIVIPPQLWQTWWFRVLLLTAAIALSYVIYRYRLLRALEVERVRTQIAADLHDDLAGNLSSIAMYTDILRSPDQRQHLQDDTDLWNRISELARESVTSIRDIVWAISTRPETVDSLLLRLKDQLLPLCRSQGIDCSLTIQDGELPETNLTAEQRQQLWMLLKEATRNALKHSQCQNLQISVAYRQRLLCITIKDDGRGFDSRVIYDGFGLKTMTHRAKALRGSCGVESSEGTGCKIELKIPF